MEILEFLKQENISDKIISEIKSFRSFYKLEAEDERRIPKDSYLYYGKEIWEEAATAIIAGENILLDGPKATGKMYWHKILPWHLQDLSGISHFI